MTPILGSGWMNHHGFTGRSKGIGNLIKSVPSHIPDSMEIGPKYIRVKVGAIYSGLSQSELYRAIYAGELRALRYKSRSWLLTLDDLDAWIDSHSTLNLV